MKRELKGNAKGGSLAENKRRIAVKEDQSDEGKSLITADYKTVFNLMTTARFLSLEYETFSRLLFYGNKLIKY